MSEPEFDTVVTPSHVCVCRNVHVNMDPLPSKCHRIKTASTRCLSISPIPVRDGRAVVVMGMVFYLLVVL